MKKSLLALAVLGAFAGAAQAQSAVTIYGSIDGGLRYLKNANGAGDTLISEGQRVTTAGSSAFGLHPGNYNNNRLGFKGVEDLGGGLNAHFNLELGFDSANGSLDNIIGNGTSPTNTQNNTTRLFQRTALVGIGGAWGSLDLGRQYSVSFKTIGAYDPFNYKYTGIIPLATAASGSSLSGSAATGTFGGTRFDNDIQYTGNFGPVTARAEYALGEVAGQTSNGAAFAVGGTYADGPLSVGAAYTRKKPAGIGVVTGYQQNSQWTVGAAYKLGAARVAAGYIDEKQETGNAAADSRVKNAWVGASYAVSPELEFTGAFYQTKATVVAAGGDGRRNLFIVGGTYALSKRTNLYFDIDRANLSGISRVGFGTASVQDSQTGVSLGVNHLF